MFNSKNILILRFPFESFLSGEEIHTIKLAEKLRERGYNVYYAGSCKVLLKEFKSRGFKTENIWLGRAAVSKGALLKFLLMSPYLIFRALSLVIKYKFRKKIDLIYCLSLNEKVLVSPFAKLFGIKVVWIEHARIGKWLIKNPLIIFYKLWNKFCPVIAISKTTGDQLRKFVANVKVVFNGIDLKEVRPELGLTSKNEIRIGTIARLYKDKGVDYFLRAAEILLRKRGSHLSIDFFILGDGPEAGNLKRLVDNSPILKGRVNFIKKLDRIETVNFLNSLNIFVLASTEHDPFGLVVAEAMVCKKPVIVTEVCGITDLLENGKNCLIVPKKREDKIAEAMDNLLINKDKTERIKENGHCLAIKKFDLERMVTEYEIIFDFK